MFLVIRSTLVQALKTLGNEFEVYESVPTAPKPPCLSIEPGEPLVVYDDDKGMDTWRARVLFLAGRVSNDDAQYRIDEGVPVVKAAIEAMQPDVAELCYPNVERVNRYGSYKIGNIDFLGVRMEVAFLVSP